VKEFAPRQLNRYAAHHMFGWRITKYDTACRNAAGAYLNDEWTSVSDIGKSFDGKSLTVEEYRTVEDAYVSTALRFLSEANLNCLHVTSLETQKLTKADASLDCEALLNPALVTEGMIVCDETLDDVCRLVLREVLWCRLESPTGFHIHFGWDYYMYVGSPFASEKSLAYGKQHGLFLEPMASPYLSNAA